MVQAILVNGFLKNRKLLLGPKSRCSCLLTLFPPCEELVSQNLLVLLIGRSYAASLLIVFLLIKLVFKAVLFAKALSYLVAQFVGVKISVFESDL